MNAELRQLKLSSGDEIVCEIVEWDDDQSTDIVIRNAYQVISMETTEGYRIYSFKPWMTFQQFDGMFQVINSSHIIGEASPHDSVISEYLTAKINYSMDETTKKRDKVEEDVIQQMYDTITRKLQEDSSGDNVIRFNAKKDTIH